LLFSPELDDASDQAKSLRFWRVHGVLWWVLIPAAVAVPFLLYGLYRRALADPGIDAEIAKERFRAEQEWRSAHRSGNDNNAA
jgi:hypothetical protein